MGRPWPGPVARVLLRVHLSVCRFSGVGIVTLVWEPNTEGNYGKPQDRGRGPQGMRWENAMTANTPNVATDSQPIIHSLQIQ